jgi:DNA (cytosine-5)-methyltransferase 1
MLSGALDCEWNVLPETNTRPLLKVAGLFAGIGGIELGLHASGHRTELLCEIDPFAQRVLRAQFPGVELVDDVRELPSLPDVDLVAAGFPCQDLSQAGKTAGIGGRNSGLVDHVFRLVRDRPVKWLLFENVPFMLQLDRGQGMRHLIDRLEDLDYRWAYRVVDTRSFGIPQRRLRVLVLASQTEDPRSVLFPDDDGETGTADFVEHANGFYWTEGTRGLGWAVDAIPTLKGGSTVGIPSPPAIWMPDGAIVTPDIRDAERLQGFPVDWTLPAVEGMTGRRGPRWKLVGNAVSVPVARWVGSRLRNPGLYDPADDEPLGEGRPWPTAAWGADNEAHRANRSRWPVRSAYQHLAEFLAFPPAQLSLKAAAGFLRRAEASRLRFPEGFLDAVRTHVASQAHAPSTSRNVAA